MNDTLTLAAPLATQYTVGALLLQVTPALIVITLVDNNGAGRVFNYTGAQASALIAGLNGGNFTTISLQKQILQQLVNDGKLQGTVS